MIIFNLSFASDENLDVNKNGSIGLDDVIYCLKKLSGLNEIQPPAFNVTGTWDVKSSFDGQLRLDYLSCLNNRHEVDLFRRNHFGMV
jgi:Leucine-rich repeat (LRR) protein